MKITTETLARLVREVRQLTGGAYGVTESARPGKPPQVTDAVAGLRWTGPDSARQAAAFYAGLIDRLADPTPEPVRRVLTEVRQRHSLYARDGRDAADTWAREQQRRVSA